jgi:hypothetical protein
MQVKFAQTLQQKTEVALWIAGKGPVTPAVKDVLLRCGLTFGAALITREVSDGYKRN